MGLIAPPPDPAQRDQIEARLGLHHPAAGPGRAGPDPGGQTTFPLQTIFFTNGVYDPQATKTGQRLLTAHELTHTVQQSRGQ